ncbi:hypothetical protein [Ferrovum sp.]|uniref:hypothetical protein n=1 Tax=Ferrovum sp. TaxID=2609467 RepID=UPI00262E1198|nr:hypothetical protein [Ferrovum sp.]
MTQLEPWVYEGRPHIEFFYSSASGVVISEKSSSETIVTSSGGGGRITQGQGHVYAPTIHSTVVRRQEIWIRKDDGTEVDVILPCRVSLREGQKVGFVVAKSVMTGDKDYVIMVNNSARDFHVLMSHDSLVKRYEIVKDSGAGMGILFLAAIAALIIGAFAIAINTNNQPEAWIFFAVGCFVLFLLMYNSSASKTDEFYRHNHELKLHLEKVAGEAMKLVAA